jgi:hypothetical protein
MERLHPVALRSGGPLVKEASVVHASMASSSGPKGFLDVSQAIKWEFGSGHVSEATPRLI